MIHALPGMGADRRMYPVPWSGLPGFIAHDWVRYSGEQTLADLAQSMCRAKGIQDGDVLIGASLGGMVACEITRIRTIPALYLIGSAMSRQEVSGLLAALHPLARLAPIDWLRGLASRIPAQTAQMFAGMEPSFFQAMCSAIFRWEGLPVCRARVLRVHGQHDLVIPPPAQVDLLLDGGHLISMTHARQCAAFVRANLDGIRT